MIERHSNFKDDKTMSTYSLALGPLTTCWRNPQRLLLTVEGDSVTDANYRTGYNDRGCAERLPLLTLDQAFYLVSRICGLCSHAHTLAFCQAVEKLIQRDVPERAALLRCAVAEIERLNSHLETLRALFSTLGLTHQWQTLRDLCEQARQLMQMATGVRMMPNQCLPGGVAHNLDTHQRNEILVVGNKVSRRLAALLDQVVGNTAISNRTVDVGVLAQPAAEQFGLRGPLARASGIGGDTRLDEPYAAYHRLGLSRIVEEGGDVYARMVVLLLEAFESIKLVDQALQDLPETPWQGALPGELPAGQASASVEGPRGKITYSIESEGRRLSRVVIDTPHQLDRLLARALFTGAQLDNVVLIALSTDTCLACAEC